MEESFDAFKAEMKSRLSAGQEVENPEDDIQLGQGDPRSYREKYYRSKFHLAKNDSVELYAKRVAQEFILGMRWVLQYYYQGVQSWDWFFPFHYAPFAADLFQYGICDEVFAQPFLIGHPFRPLDQLMAVLPPRSSAALPKPFATLMTDPQSRIIDFYPKKFKEDQDGKRFKWQWVALLPFINHDRLLHTLNAHQHLLNQDETRRNSMSDELLFVSSQHPLHADMIAVLAAESAAGDVEKSGAPVSVSVSVPVSVSVSSSEMDGAVSDGMFGTLSKPRLLHQPIISGTSFAAIVFVGDSSSESGKNGNHRFPVIKISGATACAYNHAVGMALHSSALLAGARLADPELTLADLNPGAGGGAQRSTRFNAPAAVRMILQTVARMGGSSGMAAQGSLDVMNQNRGFNRPYSNAQPTNEPFARNVPEQYYNEGGGGGNLRFTQQRMGGGQEYHQQQQRGAGGNQWMGGHNQYGGDGNRGGYYGGDGNRGGYHGGDGTRGGYHGGDGNRGGHYGGDGNRGCHGGDGNRGGYHGGDGNRGGYYGGDGNRGGYHGGDGTRGGYHGGDGNRGGHYGGDGNRGDGTRGGYYGGDGTNRGYGAESNRGFGGDGNRGYGGQVPPGGIMGPYSPSPSPYHPTGPVAQGGWQQREVIYQPPGVWQGTSRPQHQQQQPFPPHRQGQLFPAPGGRGGGGPSFLNPVVGGQGGRAGGPAHLRCPWAEDSRR